ncbi:Tyrosine--tRNA ligase chloroplastic/mitochondrial [Bienertia sinuspersici]
MTAVIALPITTRSLFSYHRCFPIYPLSPVNAFSTATTSFAVSLPNHRPHQTLASVSPNLSTITTSVGPQLSRNVIDILEQRGLIESITSENLRSACSLKGNQSPMKVYCGFDPTAESLHLGNLIGIIVLSWFQRCGHKPVAVLGGATGRVGDPSGKSTERPELDDVTLEKNIDGTELIRKILAAEGAYGLTFPLLLKSDGTKFGKSEEGAILTFLDIEHIEEIEREMKKPGYVPNSAQRRLAEELTRFVHGEAGLKEAIKATEALRPGLLDSKSAVRRMLKQGGLYLNNSRVDSESKSIVADDIVDGKVLLLSAGKKNKMDL